MLVSFIVSSTTPWKTNMSPKNQRLEDVFPIEIVPFLGDMLVFGGVPSWELTYPPSSQALLSQMDFRTYLSVGYGLAPGTLLDDPSLPPL